MLKHEIMYYNTNIFVPKRINSNFMKLNVLIIAFYLLEGALYAFFKKVFCRKLRRCLFKNKNILNLIFKFISRLVLC